MRPGANSEHRCATRPGEAPPHSEFGGVFEASALARAVLTDHHGAPRRGLTWR